MILTHGMGLIDFRTLGMDFFLDGRLHVLDELSGGDLGGSEGSDGLSLREASPARCVGGNGMGDGL